VKLGLVASLARPGGNATGINFFLQEIVAKRVEILLQLQTKPARIAVLLNPADPVVAETTLRDVQEAARAIALPIHILNASTNSEIDAAFAALASEGANALFVMSSNYFASRRVQLAVLAARYRIPVILPQREFVEAGGLMSYGTDIADSIRQVGVYAGKFSRGPSRPICRSRSRPSSSSSLICKPRSR
jgi:ABC-type uncharacterized transport system substrate-binding protein